MAQGVAAQRQKLIDEEKEAKRAEMLHRLRKQARMEDARLETIKQQ